MIRSSIARALVLTLVPCLAGCISFAPKSEYDPAEDQPWVSGAAAKILSPVQVVPNIVTNTLVCLSLPVQVGVNSDPDAGGNQWPLAVLFFPIVAPATGVMDAWHGYGFWQPGFTEQHRDYGWTLPAE